MDVRMYVCTYCLNFHHSTQCPVCDVVCQSEAVSNL